MARIALSKTEIGWLVLALNHELAALEAEVEETDSDLIKNLGAVVIETREALRTKLTDIATGNAKTIAII